MEYQAKILVVDDEFDNFNVIQTLLHYENYQLDYAKNAILALEQLKSKPPDVILLDIMMPEMDGITFCQILRADSNWQHIPIIVITALTAKEDMARCLSAGANDFISKPVNSLELRARVRSMLRIKQQYDALQATLQFRQELADMIVHDLRTPLANILLAAEMLHHSGGLALNSQRQKVDYILTCGQQLQGLIDNLLLMAKIESEKLILQPTEVDLHTMCTQALSRVEAIASQKDLNLVSDLPEPGKTIIADASLLSRILDNLLSNAIKFAPVKSQITLSASYPMVGRARIRVADNGPGIPKEARHCIFEKFVTGTWAKHVSQIGLGLAFCRLAIEAHGGKIWVDSNQPRGAIFTVEL
jgi:signal transduction histidine kinase